MLSLGNFGMVGVLGSNPSRSTFDSRLWKSRLLSLERTYSVGDYLDFHFRVSGKSRYLNGRSGWWRSFEEFAINRVEGSKLLNIGQKNCAL